MRIHQRLYSLTPRRRQQWHQRTRTRRLRWRHEVRVEMMPQLLQLPLLLQPLRAARPHLRRRSRSLHMENNVWVASRHVEARMSMWARALCMSVLSESTCLKLTLPPIKLQPCRMRYQVVKVPPHALARCLNSGVRRDLSRPADKANAPVATMVATASGISLCMAASPTSFLPSQTASIARRQVSSPWWCPSSRHLERGQRRLLSAWATCCCRRRSSPELLMPCVVSWMV